MRPPSAAPVVGVETGLDALLAFLVKRGYEVKVAARPDLAGIDVYCTTTYAELSDEGVARTRHPMS